MTDFVLRFFELLFLGTKKCARSEFIIQILLVAAVLLCKLKSPQK